MAAAFTTLPVLGVPVESKALKGLDSLLSIAQMPAGVPVGTLAIGEAGGKKCRAAGHFDPGACRTKNCAAVGSLPREADADGAGHRSCLTRRHELTRSPGSTIGCLGGGQLGRMFALAARKMGYRVHTVDPTTGQSDRPDFRPRIQRARSPISRRSTEFARGVDVVTYEFENIPVEAARSLAPVVLLRPGRDVLLHDAESPAGKAISPARRLSVAPFRVVQE